MKRQTKIVIIIAVAIVIVLVLTLRGVLNHMNRSETELYQSVRNHVETYGESSIILSELTDFQWERAVYFHYTNSQVIYETAGVHFAETDLTIGILFLNEGEIVYYEFFPQRASGGIDLRPIRISMQGVGQRVAVFESHDVFEIGSSVDYFGETLYWIRLQN